MFKPSVLLLALLLSGSTLWSAFMDGSMSVTDALIRFLIAIPVAAAMVWAFRLVTDSFGAQHKGEPVRQVGQAPRGAEVD